MGLDVIISKSSNPCFNLSLEEYFLEKPGLAPGTIYLFFYENLPSVILGKSLDIQKEVFTHKKTPPVIRRASGGGSVVHFRGNLNFGLLLSIEQYPELYPIDVSYQKILGALARAYPLPAQPAGISDLSVWQQGKLKKVSGNSQVRRKKKILHHGTLLYDLENLPAVNYYLRPPPKEPEYRQNRNHKDFLIQSIPATAKAALIRRVIETFSAEFALSPRLYRLNNAEKREIRKRTAEFAAKNLIKPD